jgi:hypothetical protein
MSNAAIPNDNKSGSTTIEVPKKAAKKPASADGTLDPQLLQEVLNKYAENKGLQPGQTAAQLGVKVNNTPVKSTSTSESFVVTNVAAGNNQNQGLTEGAASHGSTPVVTDAAIASLKTQVPAAVQSSPGFIRSIAAFQTNPPNDPNSMSLLVDTAVDALLKNPNLNVNALVQLVLMESYRGGQKDLVRFSKKVEFYNQVKAQLRDNENAANAWSAKNLNPAGGFAPGKSWTPPQDPSQVFTGDTKPGKIPHDWGGPAPTDGKITTQNAMDAYTQKVSSDLQTVGDTSGMANLQLQQMATNQSNLLQEMSQLIKSVADTSSAIIRNIAQ